MQIEAVRNSDGERVTLDVEDCGVEPTRDGPMRFYGVACAGRHVVFGLIDPDLLRLNADHADAFIRVELAATLEAAGYMPS